MMNKLPVLNNDPMVQLQKMETSAPRKVDENHTKTELDWFIKGHKGHNDINIQSAYYSNGHQHHIVSRAGSIGIITFYGDELARFSLKASEYDFRYGFKA